MTRNYCTPNTLLEMGLSCEAAENMYVYYVDIYSTVATAQGLGDQLRTSLLGFDCDLLRRYQKDIGYAHSGGR